MSEHNQRILLASRPDGKPAPEHFKLDAVPVAEPADGQVLLKVIFLSLDPYMRGRMNAGKSYAKPVEVGDVMEGGTVARVVRSRHPDFAEGDVVLSYSGWQSYAVADGATLRKIDPSAAPVSTALGVLGMPGFTAYAGLLTIGQPQPGETVVVAAASGAGGRPSAKLRRSRVRAQSASRVGRTSAHSCGTNSASMPWSIIARRISRRSSRPPVRKGSTSISKMWADMSGTPSSRC